MKKERIISDIEQNLSILLSMLNYYEYVRFIKTNKLLNLYDKNIDKPYFNSLFNESVLLKINEIIKYKIKNI